MVEQEKVVEIVYRAIDSVNEQLPRESWLEKLPDTVLYGNSSKLDSLGFVNLVLAIEESIEDEFDIVVTIADKVAVSQESNPFRTVESLIRYIADLLEERIAQ